MHVAARRDLQETLRPDIGRTRGGKGRAPKALLAVVVQPIQNPMRLLPGEFIGFGNDRAEGDPDARTIGPARFCGFRIDAVDLLFRLRERLSPEAEDVAERAADAVGCIRRAAERNRDHAPGGAHRAAELLELVVLSVEVEGRLRCPHQTQDADIFLLPLVALLLVEEIALTCLFVVAAAGNEVDNDASAAQLIQGCERFGRDRRIDGVGAERDDDLDVLRVRENRGAERERIERRGGVGEQGIVEPVIIEGAGIALQEKRIHRRVGKRV